MPDSTLPKLHLPPPGKSFWIPEESLKSILLYHSWGMRNFHQDPCAPIAHEGDVDLFVLKGKAELDLGKKTIPIEYPSYLNIPAHIPQGWKGSGRSVSMIVYCWIWKLKENSTSTKKMVTHRHLDSGLSKKVLWAHRETRWTQNLPMDAAIRHLQSVRDCMENWIQHLDPLNDFNMKKSVFSKAEHWILRYLSRPQKVQDLADYLGISLQQLQRLFQLHAHSSPDQFIQMMKYREAKKLLREGKSSIKQIAYDLGYRHANDFTRAFKKWSCESPSTYSKKCGL